MSKTFQAPWGALLSIVGCLGLVQCTSDATTSQADAPTARQSRPLTFEPAFLVKELDSTAAPRLTRTERPMLRVGRSTYFTAPDRSNGTELWKTDGTAEGTSLVRDICPGLCSSNPRAFTEFGGLLYFTAEDRTNGRELWRTDGTAAGTVLVMDLYPGSSSSAPLQLATVGGQLLFTATHPQGSALWKSNGTAAGTSRLLDGVSLSTGARELNTVPVVADLYFFAVKDENHGEELWTSNGTVAGTRLVKDIRPGRGSSTPHSFTVVKNRLFFVADDGGTGQELWTSNGTEPGTRRVEDVHPGLEGSEPESLTEVNGLLFFSADDGGTGRELYRSDGTEEGTFLVKDIIPVGFSSSPELLTDVGGTLFFSARDAPLQHALWSSDGTADGTRKLAVLDAEALVEWGGTLYLSVRTAGWGRALWKSQGTPEGTVPLAELLPPLGTSASVLLAPLDTALALWVEDGAQGRVLWTHEDTAQGTRRVRDFPSSTDADGLIAPAADIEGTLFFVGSAPGAGNELWKSDGTPEGTLQLKDLLPGAGSSNPQSFTVMDGRLYFWANRASSGSGTAELWTSDGTEAGTQKLASLADVGRFGSDPPYLVPCDGRLYFTARSSRELWWSNGTSSGTYRLKDFWPAEIRNLTAVGSTLYFSVNSYELGQTLWKTDGTASGTVQVRQLGTYNSSTSPHHFTGVGETLYLWVTPEYGDTSPSLWKSDGTKEGTRVLLAHSALAGLVTSPDVAVPVGGNLFFAAETPDGKGFELWKSNGTPEGTVRLKELGPHAWFTGIPASLLEWNGRLFFLNNDGLHGYELWTSDGTPEGTVPVKDVAPGLASAIAGQHRLVPLGPGGPLVFTASDGLSGLELWQTDGTEAGTRLLQDLAPGAASSNPRLLGTAGRFLFFQADDGTTGNELWALANPFADRTAPTLTCPPDQTLEATSLQGAPARFPAASAADDRTASPRIRYSPAAGTPLALGSHSVTATAIDAAGNNRSCTFQVTVRDTTHPTLTCPGSRTAEATSPEGALVTYPPATAVDAASTPALAYSQASGTLFPLGDTSVKVEATDGVGLSATCAFSVSVQDTLAPTLSCPSPQTAEATSPRGAEVDFPPATATDAVSTPTLDYSLAPGSTFPLGTSLVRVTATDGAGHASQCSFQVRVRDLTPPTLTCPGNVSVEARDSTGADVSYPAAITQDIVSPVNVTYSSPTGARFPPGTTEVRVTATDQAGNVSHCQFQVSVRRTSGPDAGTGTPDAGPGPGTYKPPPEYASGCGCQSGGGAAAVNAVLLAWGLVALRVRRRGPTVDIGNRSRPV
jgi:ELWxxDGT repeat protein